MRDLLDQARQSGVPFDDFHAETVCGAMRDHPAVIGFFDPA